MHEPDAYRLSELLDHQLDPEQEEALRNELEKSDTKRTIYRDLALIKDQLGRSAPPLPIDLYERVQAQVDTRYGNRVAVRRKNWLWLLIPVAVTILILIFLPDRSVDRMDAAQRDMMMATLQVQRALANLEEISMQRMQSMPEETANVFAQHLNMLEQAIAESKALLEQYPDEYLAHTALVQAYQAKIDLLQQIINS